MVGAIPYPSSNAGRPSQSYHCWASLKDIIMFPRLTKTSPSLRAQQPVHIPLQPMSSPPSTFANSAEDENGDMPEWSYSTLTSLVHRRSVSSSSIASSRSSNVSCSQPDMLGRCHAFVLTECI